MFKKNKQKNKSKYLERYLKHGNRLIADFTQAGRAYRETLRAFLKFSGRQSCITIFGSARFAPEDKYCLLAEKIAGDLAKAGFSIMTGGGPGVMQAANKGAFENGGKSFGCCMQIPHEEKSNTYMNRFKNFKYFFTRKLILTKYSDGFIILPGGFGTLDELFEVATLIKVGRIEPCPLVIMGKEYWNPLLDFIKYQMTNYKTINADVMDMFFITDDAKEALEHIKQRLGTTEV